jgi:predicted nuclease of predicted toxin-antitoxin system
MKFLANENIPFPSIKYLRDLGIDISAIVEISSGISDEKVMQIAVDEKRTILTLDSDYGELIFKYGYRPKQGVLYFRLLELEPEDVGKTLMKMIENNTVFSNSLTVVNSNFIRQRPY